MVKKYIIECCRLFYWIYFKSYTFTEYLQNIDPELKPESNPYRKLMQNSGNEKLRSYANHFCGLTMITPLLTILLTTFLYLNHVDYSGIVKNPQHNLFLPTIFIYFLGWIIGAILPMVNIWTNDLFFGTVITIAKSRLFLFTVTVVSSLIIKNQFVSYSIINIVIGVAFGIIFGIFLSIVIDAVSNILFGVVFIILMDTVFSLLMANFYLGVFWLLSIGLTFGIAIGVAIGSIICGAKNVKLSFISLLGCLVATAIFISILFAMFSNMSQVSYSNNTILGNSFMLYLDEINKAEFLFSINRILVIITFFAWTFGVLRLYFWLPEVLWISILFLVTRQGKVSDKLRYLPPYFDQTIHFPLPFISSMILKGYRENPEIAIETINYLNGYTNQQIVSDNTIENIVFSTLKNCQTIQDIVIVDSKLNWIYSPLPKTIKVMFPLFLDIANDVKSLAKITSINEKIEFIDTPINKLKQISTDVVSSQNSVLINATLSITRRWLTIINKTKRDYNKQLTTE